MTGAAVAIAVIVSMTLITRWALAYAESPPTETARSESSAPLNGHTHPDCTHQDEYIPSGMRCISCMAREAAEAPSDAAAYAAELEPVADKLHKSGMSQIAEYPSLGRSELQRASHLRVVIKSLRSGELSVEEAIARL